MPAPLLLPVALNVQGKPCLVVGGGPVAVRKAVSLIECGAHVTVIAPEISAPMRALAGIWKLEERPVRPDDCAGMSLVFACTDSPALNFSVAASAAAAGAWCNGATTYPSASPNINDTGDAAGDFTMMATLRHGPVAVGVTTGGASPALAVHLRDRIAGSVGEEYGRFARLLNEERVVLRGAKPNRTERSAKWRRIIDSNALQLLREGRDADVIALIDEILEQ